MSELKLKKEIIIDDSGYSNLRVYVEEYPEDVPGEFFVFQTIPETGDPDTEPFIFVNVAGAAELDNVPVDDSGSTYNRKHWINLLFRSRSVADEYWERILNQVTGTLQDYVRMHSLPPSSVTVEEL